MDDQKVSVKEIRQNENRFLSSDIFESGQYVFPAAMARVPFGKRPATFPSITAATCWWWVGDRPGPPLHLPQPEPGPRSWCWSATTISAACPRAAW